MIVHLWEWQFKVEKLSSVHVASFNRRRQRAERRLLRCEKDFWTMADPEIDAWMLVTGRTRDVFDLEAFAKTYGSEYLKLLLRIRKIVDVRVIDAEEMPNAENAAKNKRRRRRRRRS